MTKRTPLSLLKIFTIGHSTRPFEEFVDMLRPHGIQLVIDVRTIPKSRHNPQYNGETLAKNLQEYHIGYEHMPGLGGLRHARKDSVNSGWQNASFRGFADYMQTDEFKTSLDRLIETARTRLTVIMCAEAVPWRCHRSLIGDALLIREVTVMNIMSKGSTREHSLNPMAVVEGKTIFYPSGAEVRNSLQRE